MVNLKFPQMLMFLRDKYIFSMLKIVIKFIFYKNQPF